MSVTLFFLLSVSTSMLGMYAIFSRKALVTRGIEDLTITWATGVTISSFLTTSIYAVYAGEIHWLAMWALIPPFFFGMIQAAIFEALVKPLLSTSEKKEEKHDSKIVNISQRRM